MFKIIITFSRIYSYIYQYILVFSNNTGILFTEYILSLVMSILLLWYCIVMLLLLLMLVFQLFLLLFLVLSLIFLLDEAFKKNPKKQLNDSLSVTTR